MSLQYLFSIPILDFYIKNFFFVNVYTEYIPILMKTNIVPYRLIISAKIAKSNLYLPIIGTARRGDLQKYQVFVHETD